MISMDKKYKTRDGRDVRILCTDAPGDYPVVGLINNVLVHSWTSNGAFNRDPSLGPSDLIEVNEWEDFKIDEPVMVSNTGDPCVRRHFAGIKDGKPTVWDAGATRWTANRWRSWDHFRRPTPEELEKK